MKIDRHIGTSLDAVGDEARQAEAAGFDAVWMAEAGHDVFLLALLAAGATEHIQVGTDIAVAFSRNPMSTAYAAWDVNAYARGRFVLGLGSQIKPHIQRRFSMPWSHPAARMGEFVAALHAIWDSWQEGTRLNFQGDFYSHTLMTPMFNPGTSDYGRPKVFLAGVGQAMTRVAGEVADGMLIHPFTTERYLREITLPAIEEGMARSGRRRDDFQLHCPVMIVTGATPEELEAAAVATRKQLAFYGSTPAYQAVLELHGWEGLHQELNRLSKQGEWDAMAKLIDDDVLSTFAVVGEPDEVGRRAQARFEYLVDRISLYPQYDMSSMDYDAQLADLQEKALLSLKAPY